MYICEDCKKEMVCQKTGGVIAKWGAGHCYRSDRFECPSCKKRILATAYGSHHDTEEHEGIEYVQMRD